MPKKHQQIDFFCRQHKKTLKITNKNTLYADNIKRGQATLSNVIFFRSQHELLFLQTTLPRTAWPLRILGVSVFFGRITPTTARWEQKSHHLFLAKPFYKFMSFEQFDKGQSRQSVAGALSITHVNELLLTPLEAYFLVFFFFIYNTWKSNFALFLWESVWVFKFLIRILNKIISIHENNSLKIIWKLRKSNIFEFPVLSAWRTQSTRRSGRKMSSWFASFQPILSTLVPEMQKWHCFVWPNSISARTRDAKMIQGVPKKIYNKQ